MSECEFAPWGTLLALVLAVSTVKVNVFPEAFLIERILVVAFVLNRGVQCPNASVESSLRKLAVS